MAGTGILHSPLAHILVGLHFHARVHNAKQWSQVQHLLPGSLLDFLSSSSLTGGWTRRNRARAPVPGSSSALELAQRPLCFRLDLQMPLKGTTESSLYLPEDQRGSSNTQDHPRRDLGSFRPRSRGRLQDQGELWASLPRKGSLKRTENLQRL